MQFTNTRITFIPWVIFAVTLLALNCIFVAILRFGFAIHEKSSLLIDMIIFNVMIGPVSFGSFLGFAIFTSLIILFSSVSFSAKTQLGWATTAGFVACTFALKEMYNHPQVISNYLRWAGFTVTPSEMNTFVVLGVVIGFLSGVLALLIVVSFTAVLQFLTRHDPTSRTA
jgi:hypothetical protein